MSVDRETEIKYNQIVGTIMQNVISEREVLKMKWKRRKTRKNLRWVSPWMAEKLPDKAKTSIYLIVDFVREYYGVPYEIFEKINDEFYGWS